MPGVQLSRWPTAEGLSEGSELFRETPRGSRILRGASRRQLEFVDVLTQFPKLAVYRSLYRLYFWAKGTEYLLQDFCGWYHAITWKVVEATASIFFMFSLGRPRSEDLVAYHDCDRSEQVCSLDLVQGNIYRTPWRNCQTSQKSFLRYLRYALTITDCLRTSNCHPRHEPSDESAIFHYQRVVGK